MKTFQNFTAIIEKGNDGFVALCSELDVASQGDTVEEAKNNLQEAIELLLAYSGDTDPLFRDTDPPVRF